MTQIGQPTRLLEGRPKVLGAVRYCTDLKRPGMLHGRLVMSPHAHARIVSIDTEEARRVPGVTRVLTAQDLPDVVPTGRARLLLARDRVLFVGHPVALVVAQNEAAAQDAAELVAVEYDPQPAAVTLDEARAEDAPLVWPDGLPGRSDEAAAHGADDAGGGGAEANRPSNVAAKTEMNRGDLEAGFAEADVVLERTFYTAPVHQSYMEPHATVVEPEPLTGGATVWTSTQAPFLVREHVAVLLGVPESDVRVVATPVGGGFGGKFPLYEPLVALACRLVGRAVRLVLTRQEEMLSANPAPGTEIRLRVGARRDGTLTALEAELAMDNGCYPSSMSILAGILLGSHYRVPNQRVRGLEVLSFKASTGAYRAPCAPQCAFALETVLDELAAELGLDPLKLRLANASGPGDPMATERPWPSMGLHQVLEELQAHPAWREREDARAQGRGVGIAIGGWPGGTEPAAAACSLERDGTLHVHVGSVDLTGTNTGLALLAAEAFGVDVERIRIVTGDTESAPYAGATGGSKILYTMGPAVLQAAREARQQTLALAAKTFEADPRDLEIVDGAVRVKGSPDKAVPLAKIAQRTMRFGSGQAPVYAQGRYANNIQSPGFCAQLAEVEVDPETGNVAVHRLVVIQDVGRAVNPPAVEGQMMGGAVQGLGWALYEQMAYDEQGQLLTASLTDYALPHSQQAPPRLETRILEVPTEHGPLGARGVGEPPVIPTSAAVANAIADLTGARLHHLPMTAPRVMAALEQKRPAS